MNDKKWLENQVKLLRKELQDKEVQINFLKVIISDKNKEIEKLKQK